MCAERFGDVRRAVRVVLEPLHLADDTVLVAAEVDDPVVTLVATALVPGGDAAVVVASGAAHLLLDQRRQRLALVQLRADHLDDGAPACRGRLDFDERHQPASCKKLIS